ncbi:hypothetical protein ASG73_06345 [Janibacter sp. Soil728]|nr:hypothetical protein ASG73_06345 [Janibacter sp. Soil728]
MVLVPAHNEEGQIAATIESLLGQTHRPHRIVIAVDNSTDETLTIAQQYPVTVMETLGNTARKAGALNQAWWRHARDADYVLTMDADTVLVPTALEGLVEALSADPDRGAVCARYWAKDSATRGLAWRLQRLEYARYDDGRDLRRWKVQVVSGAASLYRADVLREVSTRVRGGLPWDSKSLIEDYALTLDIKTLGHTVGAAPGAHVLTDTPATFGQLWRQRLRWGRGGVDECRKRGWTPATRRDILAYFLFGASSLLRLLWVAYVIALIYLGLGLAMSLIGLIPLVVMWVDRVTSAWRVPGRAWEDVLLSALLIVEDVYGVFLECCTAVAVVGSFRSTSQDW